MYRRSRRHKKFPDLALAILGVVAFVTLGALLFINDKQEKEQQYDYFEPDSLPVASTEILDYLKGKKAGIVTVGITQEDATPYLKEKGWHICSPFVFLVEGQYHTRWSFLV